MILSASHALDAVGIHEADIRRQAPIGVFDSGIGGLSVVMALQRRLPAEDIVYFADSANCPYGEKDESLILKRSYEIAHELINRGVKLLVVACNTACAVALEMLRSVFDLDIVGLEPAVKPAVQLTKTGRIGVFATPHTISSQRLNRLIDEHAGDVIVDLAPAVGWVELVENGVSDREEALALVEPVVAPAMKRGADVLVLGCTHYPFLAPSIEQITGGRVMLVESGPAVARRTGELLQAGRLTQPEQNRQGRLTLVTSGTTPFSVGALASRLLGAPVAAQSIAV